MPIENRFAYMSLLIEPDIDANTIPTKRVIILKGDITWLEMTTERWFFVSIDNQFAVEIIHDRINFPNLFQEFVVVMNQILASLYKLHCTSLSISSNVLYR